MKITEQSYEYHDRPVLNWETGVDEFLDPDDDDAVDGAMAELSIEELVGLGDDWRVVTGMLPAQWEAKAR